MDHIGLFDRKILETYRETTFCFKDESGQFVHFTVKESERFPALKQKRFAVLTAFNPMNVVQSDDANKGANLLLENELKKRPYLYYPTRGALGGHVEESFTVEDIPQEEAVALGRQFAQYAILYNDENGPRFIRC